MLSKQMLGLALTLACANATLEPTLRNSKGRCPTKFNCQPAEVSNAIQAAECSHNTRTSETQTFAVFHIDHQYDGNHGAPYGTCSAYTCEPPNTPGQMKNNKDCWTFFWDRTHGWHKGVGTGCIRDPDTGECGCEDSNGMFHVGEHNCT